LSPNSVTIERFCYSDFGTFGNLILPSGEVLATVERPWIFNRRRVSCIPIGRYHCEPRVYNRGGYNAVEITGVPDRTHILFHVGNFVRNSNGCILINESHSAINGEWCGIRSRYAFNHFMKEVGYTNFNLLISNRQGGKL